MVWSSVETQILQDVLSLAVVVAGSFITALATKAQQWIGIHMQAQSAKTADTVIDGLSKIATAVVHDLEQRVVSDAKKAGIFTPEMAQYVKADAVAAVQSQGKTLIDLGNQVTGDTGALLSTLIEQAVLNHKKSMKSP